MLHLSCQEADPAARVDLWEVSVMEASALHWLSESMKQRTVGDKWGNYSVVWLKKLQYVNKSYRKLGLRNRGEERQKYFLYQALGENTLLRYPPCRFSSFSLPLFFFFNFIPEINHLLKKFECPDWELNQRHFGAQDNA